MEEKEINSEENNIESVESNNTSEVMDEMKIEDIPDNGEQRSVQEEIDNVNKNKLNQALNKISELEDKLIRKDAEMVNYRKRKEEEVNRMLKFCNEDLIKEMLPIIDNFERAISASEEGLSDTEKSYHTGVKMIYTHLVNLLEKFDVKPINGCDEPFNPVYHNAIMMEKKDGVKSGMVIEVLQKGYILKDKVIRAAMVKVSE
jgi:molecular chaperone GrpE